MKRQRANEILDSPQNIYVTYKNIPIWIDAVAEDDTVRVRDLNSELSMEVPVEELMEIGTSVDY